MEDQVVITGYGIISALGRGGDVHVDAFETSRSGIAPVSHLDTSLSHIPVGEVKSDTADLARQLVLSQQSARLRTVVLAVAALRDALAMASLSGHDLRGVDLISGTTVGGMDNTERLFQALAQSDGSEGEADQLAYNDCGASTRLIADETGNFRSITTISTACSSAANAIALGAMLIKTGKADCVIAGGAESLSKFHLNGFNSLMILSGNRCRPFDADRDGINLGEGAAYIVLESASHARERGVNPLCRLSGHGNACDAYHQTATSPDAIGPVLAMKAALDSAALKPSDIDYVNAHGTGTANNDASELVALKTVFGDSIPPYSSTKPFTGHTTSAAGAIEAVVAILAVTHGLLPPSLGVSNPADPANPPLPAPVKNACVSHVLSNSFGFGGNDTTLIFSKL